MKIKNQLFPFNFSGIRQYSGKEVDALITVLNIGSAVRSSFARINTNTTYLFLRFITILTHILICAYSSSYNR
jgi:hypothetical protein